MTLTKEEVQILKKGFKLLQEKYNIDPLNEEIDENLLYFDFPFPYEDNLEVETEHIIPYFQELESLKIHNYNRVTTDTITQRVVTVSDFNHVFYLDLLYTTTESGITLNITSKPILIGIASTQKGEYSKYHMPCSSNIAIEIKYPAKEFRLSEEDEEKLIKSFIFELSHVYRIGLNFSTFHHPEELYFDEEEFKQQLDNLPYSIEDFNPAMDLFIQANQVISDDLRFMTYYKIFEYFAPFYSKIDAYEAMQKKLNSSNAKTLNAEYIASIFELTKNYEKSIRDKELVKSLIDNTFDLVDIYKELPLSIRQKLNLETLNYKTKKEIKDRIANHLGNILYSTRNGIVHAKSNFESTGLECPDDDLKHLNEFMHKACYSTIKWHNQLPKHLKMN